jgi:hypothetical protein
MAEHPAIQHMREATILLSTWERRVAENYYKDPANTKWGKAMAELKKPYSPPAPEPTPTDTLLGVYTGSINPSGVNAFESWLGKPVDFAVSFANGDSWDTIKGLSGFSLWGNRRLHIGIPPFPPGGSLAEGASGAYDGHYTQLAENLKSRGLVNSIIRFGWEFGGTWEGNLWGVRSSTDATNFAWMFRKATIAMKAVCPTLKMDWNSVLDATIDPSLAYPGDAYVDYITFDHYDTDWVTGGMTPQQAWTHWRSGLKYGIDWWLNFADDHGKPWGVPEWGLVHSADQSGHGNGDNPIFIDQMADLFQEGDCAFQAYFQYNASDGRHHLDLFPQSKARYQERF